MGLSVFDIRELLRPTVTTMPADDFRILDSWIETKEEDKDKTPPERRVKYMFYRIRVVDPQSGEQTELVKAMRFYRIRRLPKSAKESKTLMDAHSQILSALYENEINFITIIANIMQPEPLGMLFLYGVQGVDKDLNKAMEKCDQDFVSLGAAIQGTYKVMHLSELIHKEGDWLKQKMFSMKYMTAVRGIPKANRDGVNISKTSMDNKEQNPSGQGVLEELIFGMADYEYVIQILTTPVKKDTLFAWSEANEINMSDWNEQLSGQKSLSFNLSIPMMYMANTSNSSGWSEAYSDSSTISHGTGESFNTGYGESLNNGISMSYGQAVGQSSGHSFSQSISNSQSLSNSVSQGQSLTHSIGQTLGISQGHTQGISDSIGSNMSTSMNQGQNMNQGMSMGQGISAGQSFNQGSSINQGQSLSQGFSQGQSYNQSLSQSSSISDSVSAGRSQSFGSGQSWNTNQGQNMSTSLNSSENVGYNMGVNKGQSYNSSQSASYGGGSSFNRSLGYNFGFGMNAGLNAGNSVNDGSSENFGANFFGFNWGSGSNSGFGNSNGFSVGLNANQSFSDNISMGQSENWNLGGSYGVGGSLGMSEGMSAGSSVGRGLSVGDSVSFGQGTSINESYGFNASQSQSVSNGQSFGQSLGATQSLSNTQGISTGWGQSASLGQSSSVSQNQGLSNSIGQSLSYGVSQGVSQTHGTSESVSNSISNSFSNSDSYGQSYSTSQGYSQGLTQGRSIGETNSTSYTQNVSQGTSQSVGSSKSVSQGRSISDSSGRSLGQSLGTTGAYATATGGSMGLGPSIGFSKSYQWLDQQVKDILEILEYENERLKNALKGNGAFYTYVHIACPTIEALSAAKALAKSAWQNEHALRMPLQVLNLETEEQKHLLYHFQAFSADVTRVNVSGATEYKYCTVLLPSELVAYTHPPRVSEGGIYADVNDIPKFAVPSGMKGEVFMGTILSAERYTIGNGYKTPFAYRIDESMLMHGYFTGQSRSGKTVAAMRFIAELAQARRKKTGKRFRIVCMDPKNDWRSLARFVEPERFNFYSLGNVNFHPVKLNPCKVPYGVQPQFWVDGMINIFCRAYGLLERGKQMMGETIYGLYKEAGVFDALANDDWKDVVPELSRKVTFAKIYKRMLTLKQQLEDPNNKKGRAGNDTRDAYARLLERLSCFEREFSIEYQLFGSEDGIGIDELIGKDDVTVIESTGLEPTFANFIFGIITSGFYKSAKACEGGFLAPDQYETVLVIEEANKVLTGNDCAGTGGGQNFGMSGQSEFEEILDQSAGYGLFIIAITQKISMMPSSVIANAGIVFAGRMKIPDDMNVVIRAIAREERYEDRDIVKFFPRMPTGWFICQTSRGYEFTDAEPVLVQIAPLNFDPPSNDEVDEILTRKKISEALRQSGYNTNSDETNNSFIDVIQPENVPISQFVQ